MEGLTMELLDTQGAPQSLCDQHRSVTKHLYLTLWERQWLDAPEDNTQQASCGGQITQTIEIKKKSIGQIEMQPFSSFARNCQHSYVKTARLKSIRQDKNRDIHL